MGSATEMAENVRIVRTMCLSIIVGVEPQMWPHRQSTGHIPATFPADDDRPLVKRGRFR